MSIGEDAAAMNALMDAQITSKEFDESIARNKFLHECKTRGFKHLQSRGHLKGGIQLAEKKAAPNFSPLEFAQLASKMVNNGMTITAATAEFGRNPGDLKYYCNKFGIEYRATLTKRQWDYDATYKRIYHFINRQGYRLKETAAKLDCSPKLITDILGSKGRKYNAKTIKIEKVK